MTALLFSITSLLLSIIATIVIAVVMRRTAAASASCEDNVRAMHAFEQALDEVRYLRSCVNAIDPAYIEASTRARLNAVEAFLEGAKQ